MTNEKKAQQWKAGDEFLPYHPDASHVNRLVRGDHIAVARAQGLNDLADKLDEYFAADQAGVPSGWMPIETAPKDGRGLLLGYFNSHGKWRTLRGAWFSADTIAETWEEEGEEGWYETSVENDDVPNCWWTEPTHWMPLPPSPTRQQEEKRTHGVTRLDPVPTEQSFDGITGRPACPESGKHCNWINGECQTCGAAGVALPDGGRDA